MRITATGFSTGQHGGDLSRFADALAHQAALGATGAEISPLGLDLVTANRLVAPRVAQAAAILARHPLAYSLHAPIAINLMDARHADQMVAAAEAAVDLTAELGAKVVVLHPGRCTPRELVDRRAALMAEERARLARIADRAAARDVLIAYENISPNRDVIAGRETSYSLDPAQLAEQLAALDHPALCACLDISHAQQGAGLWGFDMLASVATLAPWIGHLHYSDSTGVPSTFPWSHDAERLWFGVGDMHAPPGWGAVDFAALAPVLAIRQGTRLVIELKSTFHAHAAAETLAAAQTFAEAVG